MEKRVKILKFRKNGFIDLTNNEESGCNVIQCGKDKYTITNFKLQDGHDDSLPYSAILCVNNKPICKCVNDGWGGMTDMTPVDIQAKALMASANITLSKFGWSYHGTDFKLDLEFIADTLATTEANKIEK